MEYEMIECYLYEKFGFINLSQETAVITKNTVCILHLIRMETMLPENISILRANTKITKFIKNWTFRLIRKIS